jgi:hypothetical protein
LEKQMDTVNFTMLTATFTKVTGRMTRQMALEPTHMQTVLNMLASGKTINSMGRALKPGQMGQYTMGSTRKARSTEKAS